MNILIVANYNPSKGGISGVVYNHFTKLIEEGFSARIFNTKRNAIARIFILIPLICNVRKYEVVHLHGCSWLGFFPIVIGIITSKIIFKKKTIVTYHGGGADVFLKKYSNIVRWFLRKADHTTVMSKFLQDVFSKYGIETLILRNVTNLKIDLKSNMDYSFPSIISIRSLEEIYNIQDIIEAYKITKLRYTNATLQIAGIGDMQKELMALSNGCEGITFLGTIPNKEIQNTLRNNNIFISVPSIDNQPMSIIEAFSCGIVVISSNVGGVPDMIDNGRNGILVDVHNPKQIAEKIDWIMQHQEDAIKISKEGKSVAEQYQWNAVWPVLVNLYEN